MEAKGENYAETLLVNQEVNTHPYLNFRTLKRIEEPPSILVHVGMKSVQNNE
jgi:hypothetical protein